MRHWHKLLAPFFAFFFLMLALTGAGIQATSLLDRHDRDTQILAKLPVGCAAPTKPKRPPIRQWNHLLKQIHSGEEFGPLGTAINICSSAALAFFSISGFWMYLSMGLRRRRARIAAQHIAES